MELRRREIPCLGSKRSGRGSAPTGPNVGWAISMFWTIARTHIRVVNSAGLLLRERFVDLFPGGFSSCTVENAERFQNGVQQRGGEDAYIGGGDAAYTICQTTITNKTWKEMVNHGSFQQVLPTDGMAQTAELTISRLSVRSCGFPHNYHDHRHSQSPGSSAGHRGSTTRPG